jgi:hypothetical protein
MAVPPSATLMPSARPSVVSFFIPQLLSVDPETTKAD